MIINQEKRLSYNFLLYPLTAQEKNNQRLKDNEEKKENPELELNLYDTCYKYLFLEND